jgi:hypothetical protein
MIIVGDTLQLCPVRDRPLWYPRCAFYESNQRGKDMFQSFKHVVELTEQVRQSGDA